MQPPRVGSGRRGETCVPRSVLHSEGPNVQANSPLVSTSGAADHLSHGDLVHSSFPCRSPNQTRDGRKDRRKKLSVLAIVWILLYNDCFCSRRKLCCVLSIVLHLYPPLHADLVHNPGELPDGLTQVLPVGGKYVQLHAVSSKKPFCATPEIKW